MKILKVFVHLFCLEKGQAVVRWKMDSDFVKVQKKDRTSGLDGCGGAVPNFATLAELELELVDERRFAENRNDTIEI